MSTRTNCPEDEPGLVEINLQADAKRGLPAGQLLITMRGWPGAHVDILAAYVSIPSEQGNAGVRSQTFDRERVVVDINPETGRAQGFEVTGLVSRPSELPEWRCAAEKDLLLNAAVTTAMMWWKRLLVLLESGRRQALPRPSAQPWKPLPPGKGAQSRWPEVAGAA